MYVVEVWHLVEQVELVESGDGTIAIDLENGK